MQRARLFHLLAASVLALAGPCQTQAQDAELPEWVTPASTVLGCETLVVADVEWSEDRAADDGEVRIVTFDKADCSRKIRPLTWRTISEGIQRDGIFADMIKPSDDPETARAKELSLGEQLPVSRSSKYWAMIEPLVAFCDALGDAPAGFRRTCNFGAHGDDASAPTKAMLVNSLRSTEPNLDCQPDPLEFRRVPPAFKALFAPGETVKPFPTIVSDLQRDGFDCVKTANEETCSKNYFQVVQRGMSDNLKEALGDRADSFPFPDTTILVGLMDIADLAVSEDTQSRQSALGNELKRNGICLGPCAALGYCPGQHFQEFMHLNDMIWLID